MSHGGGTLRAASSSALDEETVAAELAAQLGEAPTSAVIFFASARYAMPDLATCMREAFPLAVTVGCTTAGELGPGGATHGGVSAIALDPSWGVAALPIDLWSFLFEDGGRIVAELAHRLSGEYGGLSPDRHLFVTLTDGLSGKEDLLVASLGTHAPGVPLVGGSAGDDYRFERTWVALDGAAFPNAAVVLLLEPGVPFETFHLHHFRPSEQRVVVTASEPDRRLIRELDGLPAVEVLARSMGTTPAALRADPAGELARCEVAFAFRVGSRYYLRAVMTVQEDALLMGGAVEEGAVLRVMRGGDLVGETQRGLESALYGSGRTPSGLLLFNCGGRMREAVALGVEEALVASMCRSGIPTCGFTTYGEHFGPMQVNSTLTGVAFYQADGLAKAAGGPG